MPTKALLRSTSALHAAQRLQGATEAVAERVDVAAVLARRDRFASGWKDDGQVAWLDAAGIELRRGHARLIGPDRWRSPRRRLGVGCC
jgi:dihydrolipoamide dehydrogenase